MRGEGSGGVRGRRGGRVRGRGEWRDNEMSLNGSY